MRVGWFCTETGGDGIRKFDPHMQEIDFGLKNHASEFDRTMNYIVVCAQVIIIIKTTVKVFLLISPNAVMTKKEVKRQITKVKQVLRVEALKYSVKSKSSHFLFTLPQVNKVCRYNIDNIDKLIKLEPISVR